MKAMRLRVAQRIRQHEAYSEEVFRYFLAVEQERSKRSTRPFLLLLFELKKQTETPDSFDAALAAALFSGLSRRLRETDFVGWYREGRVIGAVLTQFSKGPGTKVAYLVVQRVLSELGRCLPPDALERLQMRVYQRPNGLKARS
jgi:hypothetical protein